MNNSKHRMLSASNSWIKSEKRWLKLLQVCFQVLQLFKGYRNKNSTNLPLLESHRVLDFHIYKFWQLQYTYWIPLLLSHLWILPLQTLLWPQILLLPCPPSPSFTTIYLLNPPPPLPPLNPPPPPPKPPLAPNPPPPLPPNPPPNPPLNPPLPPPNPSLNLLWGGPLLK